MDSLTICVDVGPEVGASFLLWGEPGLPMYFFGRVLVFSASCEVVPFRTGRCGPSTGIAGNYVSCSRIQWSPGSRWRAIPTLIAPKPRAIRMGHPSFASETAVTPAIPESTLADVIPGWETQPRMPFDSPATPNRSGQAPPLRDVPRRDDTLHECVIRRWRAWGWRRRGRDRGRNRRRSNRRRGAGRHENRCRLRGRCADCGRRWCLRISGRFLC